MRRAGLLAIAIALTCAAPASAGGLRFDAPFQLPHGDPKGDPFLSGGEPSIAFDPSGDGHTYVVAPQGVPVVVGFLLGSTTQQKGIAYWASDDHGRTWPRSGNTGSLIGGGDSDVEVLSDHTVLAADLQAVAAAICTSNDFGTTFPDCDNGLVTKEAGPENDREWLTHGTTPNDVYLTYHDFVAGLPLIFHSTDKAQSFQPCGSIIDPNGPAAKTYTPTGGTLVSKPIVTSDGSIYVEFTTPTSPAPIGAKLNNLWMAVAKGGCGVNTVFKNYKIYSDPGADLGRIFQQAARDGGGRLYVVAAGPRASGDTSGMYLFTSDDDGKTWSAPVKVNPPELGANVFPTVAAGDHAGEAFVGWFGTSSSSDPNNTKNQWRFYGASTYDGGKTFNLATVTPDPIHYGDICTQGLFCGLIPGQPSNRNLADFASAAVDPADGCLALAIPGDPYNRPDLPDGQDNASSSAYVALQADRTAACFNAANSGKAAADVGGASKTSSCLDRAAPSTRLGHKGRRVSRRGLVLHGRSSDRGCRAKGRGVVARVEVALRRTPSHARLRYAAAHIDKRGNGAVSWTVRVKRRLAPGHWVAYVRAVDRSKNVGTLVRLRFRVR